MTSMMLLAKRKILHKKGWLEMTEQKEYAFVLDRSGKKLTPCNTNKA